MCKNPSIQREENSKEEGSKILRSTPSFPNLTKTISKPKTNLHLMKHISNFNNIY